MFATSVPDPPVGPPPAFGAGASRGVDFGSTVGVAGAGRRTGGVFGFAGAGMSRGLTSARVGGGVAGGGVGAGGVGVGGTSPMARGPAGAATRFTLYTGGRTRAGPGR